MEYNTSREGLLIPEYGRNVQKLVQELILEPDRDRRTRMAQVVIRIMAQVRQTRDQENGGDFQQKLWDHIHIISDFKLDVDSPYPPPPEEVLTRKPKRMEREKEPIRFRYFGRNVQKVVREVAELEEGEQKDLLIHTLANYLKKLFLTWNRESVDDEIIFRQMEEISGGKIKLSDEKTKLHETSDILARNATIARRKKSTKQGYRQKGRQRKRY